MTNTIVVHDPIVLGRTLAASGYFADASDAAQAAVKVMAGAEIGFGAIASMTGINIIKGKVTLSANLMAAAVKRSGKYDYVVKTLTNTECYLEFYQGQTMIGPSEFTMDDAKQAGLVAGDNWRKFPKNMLFARAIANGAKWYCPDVFGGGPIYTPDELGATVDGETGEIVGVSSVKARALTQAPNGDLREGEDKRLAGLPTGVQVTEETTSVAHMGPSDSAPMGGAGNDNRPGTLQRFLNAADVMQWTHAQQVGSVAKTAKKSLTVKGTIEAIWGGLTTEEREEVATSAEATLAKRMA